MGVNSLPKTVARQRHDCDLNPGPSAPESSTLTTRLQHWRPDMSASSVGWSISGPSQRRPFSLTSRWFFSTSVWRLAANCGVNYEWLCERPIKFQSRRSPSNGRIELDYRQFDRAAIGPFKLTSLSERPDSLCSKLFRQLVSLSLSQSHILHCVLPAQRDDSLTGRLRSRNKIPNSTRSDQPFQKLIYTIRYS